MIPLRCGKPTKTRNQAQPKGEIKYENKDFNYGFLQHQRQNI